MKIKIDENIETVINLSNHLQKLKKRALGYKALFGVGRRGYFTPTEDEKVEHLYISYWQSRAALLDLALTANAEIKRKDLEENDKLILFITGYAAAIILVNAARFISENFDKYSAIREKLNQPNKQFSIPEGVYDTAKASLSDARNIWRIHSANQMYKENIEKLEKLGKKDKRLKKLLKIIKQLRRRVRFDQWQFFKERLHEIKNKAVDNLKKPAKHQRYEVQESISRIISHIRVKPWHRANLPKNIAKQIGDLVKPGDVFITRKNYAMTNYFLPGYWPHAAIFLGDLKSMKKMELNRHRHIASRWDEIKDLDKEWSFRVLESLKDGVHIRSIETPFSCDAIAIIRPKLTTDEVSKALKRGIYHEGKPYDFDFDFRRSDRMVCTELVYRTYEGIGNIHFKLGRRAGRFNISAEDMLQMAIERELFEPIAVYCPDKSKKLQKADKVDAILHATMGK